MDLNAAHSGSSGNNFPRVRNEDFSALDLIDLPTAVVVCGNRTHYCNTAWKAQATTSAFESSEWLSGAHPRDAAGAAEALERLQVDGTAFDLDVRLKGKSGKHHWFLVAGRSRTDCLSGERYLSCTLTDIDDRKCHEHELLMRTRIQEQMLDVSADCFMLIDADDGRLLHMNRAGCEALGVEADSGLAMEWLPLLLEDSLDGGLRALDEARRGRNSRFPCLSQRAGEAVRHWDNMLTPLADGEGVVKSIVCVSRDVTADKERQNRIDLLLHELNHRSKNMLVVIQALIRRSAPDPGALFVRILEQRLASIARSQDLLLGGRWPGVTIGDLVASHTALAEDLFDERLVFEGERNLRVRPDVSEALGLAIHELTTNAIKYGALSGDRGRVTISWGVIPAPDGDRFSLRWCETGGPAVAPPSRKGFGSTLIERNPCMISKLTLQYAFDPGGVRWEIEAPARSILAGDED